MKELVQSTKRVTPRTIAYTAIIAAAYAASTLAIAPLSFGPIQLRFSEILVLLAFIDKAYAPGLILGCIIANSFSPMGMTDVVVGTACTAMALFAITKTKNLFVATLWPTVFNSLIGIELHFLLGFPLLFSMVTVALGEFAVVTCIGYPLFSKIMEKEGLLQQLRIK